MLALVLMLQTTPAPEAAPDAPAKKSWVGCLQTGNTPSTYRLNIDTGTEVAGPEDPASLGSPFLQLLPNPQIDFAASAGKHVRITGQELTPQQAATEAALRPDRQEAAGTASGTGGRPDRHLRYVRVVSLSAEPGACK
jgi:hypothetical protein